MDRRAGKLHRLAMTKVFAWRHRRSTLSGCRGSQYLPHGTPRRQTILVRVNLSLRGACDEAIHAVAGILMSDRLLRCDRHVVADWPEGRQHDYTLYGSPRRLTAPARDDKAICVAPPPKHFNRLPGESATAAWIATPVNCTCPQWQRCLSLRGACDEAIHAAEGFILSDRCRDPTSIW